VLAGILLVIASKHFWVGRQRILTAQAPPTGFIVESRSGGLNFANYSDTGLDNSTLKSTAPGTTPGIGSREGKLRRTGAPRSANFRFTPGTSGTYQVFATWAAAATNHNLVEHLVTYAGGTASLLVDQTTGQNVWSSLGQYTLIAGSASNVEITNRNYPTPQGSTKVFRADAVMWSLVAVAPTGSIAGRVTNADNNQPSPGPL
jgi:hypothetical protein